MTPTAPPRPALVSRMLPMACLLTLACGGGARTSAGEGGGGCSLVTDSETAAYFERAPFRDEWVVEADEPFLHTDDDGNVQIGMLEIGGRVTGDNFANRGDVIVNFDGPPGRIMVELRRFTYAAGQPQADEDFDKLSLWAYASGLGRPQDLDIADDCVASGWQNDCAIRVYYDGQSQLQRSGADIRVTLPADYRHDLSVTTEDNIADDDYFNRGDVCIAGLPGSADVRTGSGNVWVALAGDTTPAPKCSPAQIDACESWTETDEMGNEVPAPWAPECDCVAAGGQFGRVSVSNYDDAASNVVVDVPAGLWTSLHAENLSHFQEENGLHCDATLDVPGIMFDDTGNDFSWQARGSANYPGAPAIAGAGFSIDVQSSQCSPVAHTDSPEEFVGVGLGDEQTWELRGDVRVCSGCAETACDALIP